MPRRKKKVKHRPKDPKWHARRILEHKTQDNTPGLPPIVSSGDGGQPLFAFLSSNKFTTRKSKIAAIDFYTQYVNDHLESDLRMILQKCKLMVYTYVFSVSLLHFV